MHITCQIPGTTQYQIIRTKIKSGTPVICPTITCQFIYFRVRFEGLPKIRKAPSLIE